MLPIIADNLDAIASLCQLHGVQRLFVFGSALREDYRPGESDLDLLVEFAPMAGSGKAHAYYSMLKKLENLLGTDVDLVMSGAVRNRIIAKEIEATRQILYGP